MKDLGYISPPEVILNLILLAWNITSRQKSIVYISPHLGLYSSSDWTTERLDGRSYAVSKQHDLNQATPCWFVLGNIQMYLYFESFLSLKSFPVKTRTRLTSTDNIIFPKYPGFRNWKILTDWGWDKMAIIFQRTFSNAFSWIKMYVCITIKISPKFIPKRPINNITVLVQKMAWRRPGDKPLSEPMMVSLLTHICVTRPQWVSGLSITLGNHLGSTTVEGPTKLWSKMGIWTRSVIYQHFARTTDGNATC